MGVGELILFGGFSKCNGSKAGWMVKSKLSFFR